MIKISVDNAAALKSLDLARKQARFAAAKALTQTAKRVEKSLQADLYDKLDNPTPWIGKGTFVQPATKDDLTAVVGMKDRQARYVKEHFTAGRRGQKPYEKALAGMGVLPAGHKAVPGTGLKLDGRGNPSRAQLKEMFGSLKSGMGVAKGRGRKMAVGAYVAIPVGNRAGLAPGVYYRAQRKILPALVFVSAANYRKRMDLGQLASKTVAREFDALFAAAYAQALASAR